MKVVTEKRVADVLVHSLRHKSLVMREVRHYEKRIDVVSCYGPEQRLMGVEVKTTKWRRALQQAVLNLTAVEYSYIAIWQPVAHRVDQKLLTHYGIGLISVGSKWGQVETLLFARPSLYTNRFVKRSIQSAFGMKEAV